MLLRAVSCLILFSFLNVSCQESRKSTLSSYNNSERIQEIDGIFIPNDQFKDLDEIRLAINTIFENEKVKIAEMIRDMRSALNTGLRDDELFVTKNCGPASYAFQRVLLDYGIYAESRTNNPIMQYAGHQYLLLRAIMEDGKTKNVIIDPTYRQFFKSAAEKKLRNEGKSPSDKEVYQEILKFEVDSLIVSNYDDLDSDLKEMGSRIPGFTRNFRSMYEKGYLDSKVQHFPEQTKYLLTNEVKDRLRKGAERPHPYNGMPIFLRAEWNNFGTSSQFKYLDNGLFELELTIDRNKCESWRSEGCRFKVAGADLGNEKLNFGSLSDSDNKVKKSSMFGKIGKRLEASADSKDLHIDASPNEVLVFTVDTRVDPDNPILSVDRKL